MVESSPTLPLPALLSFAWVAFTIEGDNLLEERTLHRTTRGSGAAAGPWLVSQVMWWTCMRFVDEGGLSVVDLERAARTKTNLNGMIRWGYLTADASPLRKTTLLRPTAKGLAAREVWQGLTAEVETRWRHRAGEDAFAALKESLSALAPSLDAHLPDCMPILGYGLGCPEPLAGTGPEESPSLPVMLARALLSFTLEYERLADLSLAISANVLRLVDEQGCPLRDLPALSGVSREAIAIALNFLDRRGLACVVSDRRRRMVMLTPAGLAAKDGYARHGAHVEAQWRSRFGEEIMHRLVRALEAMVTGDRGEAMLAACMTAPATGWRAAKTQAVPPWQPMVSHRGGFPDGA